MHSHDQTWTCPGCGACECEFHRRGCKVVPFGVRPCCATPIYLDHETLHDPHCMGGWGEWNPNGWYLPDMGRDPWHDLPRAEWAKDDLARSGMIEA